MEQVLKLQRYNLNITKVCDKNIVLEKNKCDKYDYLVSAGSGIVAGLIDTFFVGSPLDTTLGKVSDKAIDNVVMVFAKKMGWSPTNKNINNVGSAIGYLEREFKVNYDQAKTIDVNGSFKMLPKNHHIMSLSHSPDIIGLFFSIIDQFKGTSHFIANGKLISMDVESQNLKLYGASFHAKLFCGFVNWIGHIMSDIAGSSGARGLGKTGRGSGLCIPFIELFQFCDFGSFANNKEQLTFAKAAVKVFENGYDFRFGVAMAIPVILNELFIKLFWIIKRRFYKKVPWDDCIPTSKHVDLRIMILIGNSGLCLIDVLDATIRSKGNIVLFLLRFNLIAWARFIMLIFKEIKIRYGNIALELMKDFIGELNYLDEKKAIQDFYARLNNLDTSLAEDYNLFVEELLEEYNAINKEANLLISENINHEKKSQRSINLAKNCKISDDKIIKNFSELDDFFFN